MSDAIHEESPEALRESPKGPALGRRKGPSLPQFTLPRFPVRVLWLLPILLFPLWVWFFCRIEIASDEIGILIRKTGRDIPSGRILALEEGEKGIHPEVLPEGRYFRNPYTWGWKIGRVVDIQAGRLGVLIRLYGDDLPPGKIVAGEGTKGIVAEVLRPGKYRVNPYAHEVQLFDATTIRPGHVGVVTSLIGRDVLEGPLEGSRPDTYLVSKGMKGVLPEVLDPGTYYLNPYVVSVVEMTLQSQRFEMSGEDAITFLTLDGFTVTVEGTIEYAISRERCALLTHKVGDMEDIVKKIILPRARGFSRIEGSKNPAIAYIVGETRQQFQNILEQHLKDRCQSWGVSIKSVLIRNISPPDAIAAIIREREVAVQTAKMFDRQIEQARSKAELTRQEMLALQNKEKVEAETGQIRALILAQQELEVRVTAAEREREVARLENRAATSQAESLLLAGDAEREVLRLENEARTSVFREEVAAFRTGMGLARYAFYGALAPRIHALLTSDRPEALGGVFGAFGPPQARPPSPPSQGKEVPR